MLVTPSTRKSHGGRSGHQGSTKPPKHASTWHEIPRSAAADATAATGSSAPVGYDVAETTTSATSSPRRLTTASAATVPSGAQGTASYSRSNSAAAFWKAACAVTGATSRGAAFASG